MKTAAEYVGRLVKSYESADGKVQELIEDIQRDALDAAAAECEEIRGERHWHDSPGVAIEYCAERIRELKP